MQSSIEREEDYLRLLNLTIDGVTTAVDYVNNSYYLPIDMDAVQPAKVKVEFGGIGVDFSCYTDFFFFSDSGRRRRALSGYRTRTR